MNLKKSTFLLVFFTLLSPIIFAQQQPTVIKSNSNMVSVKAGENFKMVWHLKPEVRLDIYTLPTYQNEQRVTITTDIDSLSFNAKSGEKYNFFILLSNKYTCHVQIATLDAPVFLKKNMSLILFAGIFLIAVAAYYKRKAIKVNQLLYLGIIAPLFFWIMTIIGGFIHGNYNHLVMVISDLGAIGTNSEIFMIMVELVLTMLCIFFSIGFYKASKELAISAIPAILTFSFPLSIFWIAVFPLQHELHGALGPIPALLNIGALLAFILWRGKAFFSIRLISLASFIITSLIFLRLIPQLQDNFPGLIQRLYYLGWSIWFISLSLFFIKLIKGERQTKLV